jgi:hypothetical protein
MRPGREAGAPPVCERSAPARGWQALLAGCAPCAVSTIIAMGLDPLADIPHFHTSALGGARMSRPDRMRAANSAVDNCR